MRKSVMNFRRVAFALILLAVAGAATIGWYRYIAHPAPVACGYCNRPLHANLSVTAEIAGKQTQACCPRCAISEANQHQKALRLIAVHDYPSGRTVAPESAWFVEGGSVMACEHMTMPMNEMKGTDAVAFDRCSPGIFSFAERKDADAFVARNGGAVLSFAQLMSEAKYK
jgi:hypothetical protein